MKGYDVGIPPASSSAAPAETYVSQVVLSIVPAACPMPERPAGEGLPANCRVTLADEEIPATDLPVRLASLLGNRPPEARVLFLGADDTLNSEGVLRIVDSAMSSVADLKIEFVETN
jgi:hypothetical protein